jgi:GNAT superfamily N-acetyltransferase
MPSGETNPDIQIRPIENGDAAEVAMLCTELGYQRSAEDISDWVARLRTTGNELAAFVACSGGVIGWIEISIARHLQSEPYALIGGLVVKQEVRSRGVGRLLCARAEAWAREIGVPTIRVTSRHTRADAHRFYLRDGYEQLKTSLVFSKSLTK